MRHILDRSARSRAGRVRELLNTWVGHVPQEARGDLLSRLRSSDDYHFLGAFWELYLAEVLHRLGYDPEFHPRLAGTRRRPDFRALASQPFLLEGTLASPSTVERAAQRRLDSLYDLLDRAPSEAFFIDAEVAAVGSHSPPAKALRQTVHGWLESIDPDALIADGVSLDVLDAHALRWQWEDWDVVLRPLPKSPNKRGDPGDPFVGMTSRGVRLIDTRSALRRALREKAGAYGKPGQPFLIGVLVLDDFADEDDVRQVLFGTEGLRLSVVDGRVRSRTPIRNRDGFWLAARPSHTRVSAAPVAINVTPWMVGKGWPTTWRNPWAMHPHRAPLPFPVIERDSTSGRLIRRPAAQKPWEFFGLDPNWPD